MNTLPDVPSELILLALHDLELCEKDPRYSIEMSEWHNPAYQNSVVGTLNMRLNFEVCAVCLAGSVMAKTLNTAIDERRYPQNFNEEKKFWALEHFRSGELSEGLDALGIVADDYPVNYDISGVMCDYEDGPEKFKSQMKAIATELKECGL